MCDQCKDYVHKRLSNIMQMDYNDESAVISID